MANYKGAPVVALRRWVRAAPGVEERLIATLTPEQRKSWEALTASTWLPVEFVTHLYATAAPLLYPAEAQPVRRLGRELARDTFGGWLSFVIRVFSAESLVEKTAQVWGRFHDAGKATGTRTGERRMLLTVEEYPDLPERMRESISGYLAQAIEMTGAAGVTVVPRADGPRWLWEIQWR